MKIKEGWKKEWEWKGAVQGELAGVGYNEKITQNGGGREVNREEKRGL